MSQVSRCLGIGTSGLVLADQQRIEGARDGPWDLYRQVALVVLEGLGRLAVKRVIKVSTIGSMLLLADMVCEYGHKNLFGRALLQKFEQAVFAEYTVGDHPVFK